ncbi:uncharacterized protein LOC118405630 isoform X1 [Branchiostoma floridae]|uniref:Uncharacterized protein LOC118405630 isoform X1 n=1 Tax=Branchiostoma floridae TaxID=7739 RepID=A0A9J7HK32_BRAFL|nr:uncharacterized protein LOC118405630 isoform X1 [Branchiostoma floridae]XP_035661088.1 uncharacterized protein LOC118405630 isoform X1 [Branchiostoma floridae]XP_035661089.1 uncharacterized protein LOC118405630 isoform X1 [Branchiostoma floridae]
MARILLVLVLAAVQTLAEEGLFGFDGLDGELAGFLDDANKITLSGVTGELPGEEDHVVLQCDVMSDDKDFPEKSGNWTRAAAAFASHLIIQMPQSDEKKAEVIQEGKEEIIGEQLAWLEQHDQINQQQSTILERKAKLKNLYGDMEELIKLQTSRVQTYMDRIKQSDQCEGQCEHQQFCALNVDSGKFGCVPCSECRPGFKEISQCTKARDVRCEDINECALGIVRCPPPTTCVNTLGGALCVEGFTPCRKTEYFDIATEECRTCTKCKSAADIARPCTEFYDQICSISAFSTLAYFWFGNTFNVQEIISRGSYRNLDQKLPLKSGAPNNEVFVSGDVTDRVEVNKEGILWVDYNFAMKHSCRKFVQMTIKTKGSGDMASARIQDTDGKLYQSALLSGAIQLEPKSELTLEIQNRFCFLPSVAVRPLRNNRLKELSKLAGPLSVLWLSPELGAVTARAYTRLHTWYRTWRVFLDYPESSDKYVVKLLNNHLFKFSRDGVVKFSFTQAVYSVNLGGQKPCTHQGLTVSPKIERSSQNVTIFKRFHKGVTRKYTTIEASGVVPVKEGEVLYFDVETMLGCQTWYFGATREEDKNGIGVANVLWVPTEFSASFRAELVPDIDWSQNETELQFQYISTSRDGVFRMEDGSHLTFKQSGHANINFYMKMQHSCDYIKLIAFYYTVDSKKAVAVAQQVLGNTQGMWDGVALSSSHKVEEDSRMYLKLFCVRGEVERVAWEWNTLSVMWIHQ